MIKVNRRGVDVYVTYIDELEQEHVATAFCKSIEAAKGLVSEVREAIKQGYGFAKCRAVLEGDTVGQHGGYRPGAGRKPTGRKRKFIYVTDDEFAEVKKLIESMRQDG